MTLSYYQLFTTQLMYSKYIRRKFGLGGEGQTQRTVKFDSAVIVEEKESSEEVMKAAEKVKPMSVDDIKKNLDQGEKLEMNEVKLSLKKVSKKKKDA
jgi:hypothetical protein